MPRKRMVSPEFFMHGDLYDLEESTRLPVRLGFAGLWCHSDRAGRFVWKPRELKLVILPYDPVDFRAVLEALASKEFVRRYVVDGKEYGWIPTFRRHQTFHKNEAPSKFPPHPEDARDDDGAEHGAMDGRAPCDVLPEHSAARSVAVTVAGTVTDAIPVTVADADTGSADAPTPPAGSRMRVRSTEEAGDHTPLHPVLDSLEGGALVIDPRVSDALSIGNDGRDLAAELARAVPNAMAYFAECRAALDGMHGFTASPGHLRIAVTDWLANQPAPNLRLFRHYIRGAAPLPGKIQRSMNAFDRLLAEERAARATASGMHPVGAK